jgi:hypothetical protein
MQQPQVLTCSVFLSDETRAAPLRRLQPLHLASHAGALNVVHTALHVVVSP